MARMNEARGQHAFRRVLVVIEPCAQSLPLFERAATLAERMQAELVALFVEDVNLINLAGLPFTSEIDFRSGQVRALDSMRMSRALRGQAEQTRRALARVGLQRQIRTSLRIVRGHFMTEAISASSDMDICFILRSGGSRLSGAEAASMIAGRRIDAHRPIWVLYDGSPAAVRALALAKQLTAPEEDDLVVVLPAGAAPMLRSLRDGVLEALGAHGTGTRFRRLAGDSLSGLREAIHQEGGSMLLIDRSNALIANRDGQRVLETIDCPVVLVS